ncbi:MAG: 50S ribosomal protein L29 [Candidatus Buchananbacteria bacterium]|nr:50S ribosomal protein L29 [Candidatus Buchananbacteria bacterium]
MTEITNMSDAQLQVQLAELREKRDELVFKVRQKQLTQVRQLRVVKRDIAQLLTAQTARKK